MPIPPLPLFRHRDTVVTPADQNQFVTQFENTMDTMSNDVIPAMNDAIEDINENVITVTTARDESVSAKNIAVAAKDEALTAVATLQEGAIDDTTIALNKAFSNQYIENNYYDKDEIDEITIINNFIDKPTPDDTDNFALQETGGLLKKLSFANLKSTLLAYFDTFYSRTADIFGIGQTWQDMTASRAIGVTYLNNTGKPIEVIVSIGITNTLNDKFFNINGVIIGVVPGNSTTGSNIWTFIVPNGSTYSLGGSNYSIVKWMELR